MEGSCRGFTPGGAAIIAPYYMLFSIVGCYHLVVGCAENVDVTRDQISKDFAVGTEYFEYNVFWMVLIIYRNNRL